MKKVISVLAVLLFMVGTAVAEQPSAQTGKSEFDNNCALGVAMGKSAPCDASHSAATTWKDPTTGKQYCFGNAQAKEEFAKDAAGNVKKAQQNWPTVQASSGNSNQS